jgi:hypothetical protein
MTVCVFCGPSTSGAHAVSRRLTSLAPQPPHEAAHRYRSPWSQRFDRIFPNEGVTGSNPVSSTDKVRGYRPFLRSKGLPHVGFGANTGV